MFAGPDSGNKPALLLHVLRNVLRVERDGRIEIREEHNHHTVHQRIREGRILQVARESLDEFAIGEEREDRARNEHDRLCKDDGHDARGVHAERNILGDTAVHLAPHHTLGILHRNPAGSLCHQNHTRDDRNHDSENDQADNQVLADAELVDDRMGEPCDDTDKNDQGDPVADTAFRDLLAKPHHEHRARGQEDYRADRKGQALYLDRDDGQPFNVHAGQPHADPPGLQRGHQHRAVPGQLRQLLAPFLPFFRQLLKIGDHGAEELENDRSADIRHDPEGEDGCV